MSSKLQSSDQPNINMTFQLKSDIEITTDHEGVHFIHVPCKQINTDAILKAVNETMDFNEVETEAVNGAIHRIAYQRVLRSAFEGVN